MRDELAGEQCVLCGTHAAVRVGGTSFCAACGLSQYASGGHASGATAPPRRRRRAALSILSTSLTVKVALGVVAIASVGAVAATAVVDREPAIGQSPEASVVTSQEYRESGTASEVLLLGENAAGAATATTTTIPTSDGSVVVETAIAAEAALEYASATRAWAECVGHAASEHSGGEFDPDAVCGEQPAAGDYGVGLAAIPDDQGGQAGSGVDGPGSWEDAPGHDNDTDDKDKAPKDDKDKAPKDDEDKAPKDDEDKAPKDDEDKAPKDDEDKAPKDDKVT